MKYTVAVTRRYILREEVEVEANSEAEAERKAIEKTAEQTSIVTLDTVDCEVDELD